MNHVPVMLQEVIASCPDNCHLIIDGTLGHGGHSFYLASKTSQLVGMDLDSNMLLVAQKTLENISNIQYVHDSYSNIDGVVSKYGKADFVLLDLGVNMDHFKIGSRGFSINYDSSLDMRFDQGQKDSAYDIVNKSSSIQLEKIFIDYADFSPSKAREIADKIVQTRKNSEIKTTFDLKNILGECGLGKSASTIIFQSIRIQTNNEIQNLEIFLTKLPDILSPGGICSIITFHSIEDRVVKKAFQELSFSKGFELVNKKVIKPTYQEVAKNKASRSAQLRVIRNINTTI
ncbi:MAG: 16S rRNA (cytosine(1402)-N(4))-methyltransferase RsmH [Candidatus Absconditicoccaceae bacterium]